MARPLGVYVHFPFCTHRCPYCDFAVTTERPPADRSYLRAVLAELRLRAPAFDGLAATSLYVGGGTPSLWSPDEIAELISAVRARLALPAGAEVTLEVNPESSDRAPLRAWREAGVNRVSVGAQSFDAGVLAKLGRRHGPEAAERAIREAAAEIGNVAAVSDAGVAVLLAQACAQSAALNVKINVNSIKDEVYNKETWSKMEAVLKQVAALEKAVMETTYRKMG
jgi:oxygen-independent coproporphyrinogen-3 oxidase